MHLTLNDKAELVVKRVCNLYGDFERLHVKKKIHAPFPVGKLKIKFAKTGSVGLRYLSVIRRPMTIEGVEVDLHWSSCTKSLGKPAVSGRAGELCISNFHRALE